MTQVARRLGVQWVTARRALVRMGVAFHPRWCNESPEWWRLQTAGMSGPEELARMLGVARKNLSRARREYGIPDPWPKGPGPGKASLLSTIEDEELEEMYRRAGSFREVANLLGCSDRTVHREFDRRGLDRRPAGGSHGRKRRSEQRADRGMDAADGAGEPGVEAASG